MSTAVLISGHMRTFKVCAYTQRWHVIRHFEQPHFYVCTVADDQAEDWKMLQKLYPGAPIEVCVVPRQPDLPEPTETIRFEPYERSVPVQAVLRQLWQLNEAWKHYVAVGKSHKHFVRIRPDLFFQSFRKPEFILRNDAFTPWWGRFGGVNDRFALLGEVSAEAYFTTFAKLEALLAAGCPLHPESLVKASLIEARCELSDHLAAEFSTLRLNGECREPEISNIDLAHAGLHRR